MSLVEAHRDKVDEWHGVVVNAPQRHDAHSVHGDHDDGEEVEQARAQVQTQQDAADHEGGQQAQRDVEQALWDYRQVLLIEHVRHPGRAPTHTHTAMVTQLSLSDTHSSIVAVQCSAPTLSSPNLCDKSGMSCNLITWEGTHT